jgi:hypothetical protein
MLQQSPEPTFFTRSGAPRSTREEGGTTLQKALLQNERAIEEPQR